MRCLMAALIAISLSIPSAFVAARTAEAATIGDAPVSSARVVYHFVPQEQLDDETSFADYENTNFTTTAGNIYKKDGKTFIQGNANPGKISVSTDDRHFRVIENYAAPASANAFKDLTDQASYDPKTGLIELPEEYADRDITIVWYISDAESNTEIPVTIKVVKALEGTASYQEIEGTYKASDSVMNVKLFDSEEEANKVQNVFVAQGGQEVDNVVFDYGSITIGASALGGEVTIELDDNSSIESVVEGSGAAINSDSNGGISTMSAAVPYVGERFYLDADNGSENVACIRTCEPSTNMASILGWPSKSGTYGFVVQFRKCSNPEVLNADQNHVAKGGWVTTSNGGRYDYNWAKGTHFAWGECEGDVDNNGNGEPRVESGSYVEVTNVNFDTQTVSYKFHLNVRSDTDGHNMQSIHGTFQVHEDLHGWMKVKKQSSNTSITDNNPCYDLAGAEYSLFKSKADAEAGTNAKGKATTDSEGNAKSTGVSPGKYFVKETKPAQNYALDETIYEITIEGGKTATLNADDSDHPGIVYDTPQNDPVNIWLGKHDGDRNYNGAANIAQAGAPSVADAQFTVKYYPVDTDKTDADLSASDIDGVEPLRTWVMKTNENGFINMKDENIESFKVAGDDFYYSENDSLVFPVGIYTIQETKAPEGYNIDNTVFYASVKGDGTISTEEVSTYNTPIIPNYIARGGISIEKRDFDTGALEPQGGASLDGTTFVIVNENDKGAFVDGIEHNPGEVCKTLVIENGKAWTDDQCLPYGDYSIQEVAAGKGYSLTDGEKRYFSITEDRQMVNYSETEQNTENGAFKNKVKRGDIEFIKKSDVTGHTMAGIPFKITSKTTGESHIVVTDDNGQVNTASSFNKHSYNTNGNDGGDYDAENGIWFGTAAVDDERGALPYDTYTIEELPCENNQGYTMIEDEFTITRDNHVFNYGTITNQVPASKWISTHATDATDSDKIVFADTEAVINDHVSYGGLEAGKDYTLSASLINKETGEVIPGATAQVTFTASGERGSVEVQIPVNLVDYANKDVVVFEVLTLGDQIIAEHKDADDSEQTVHVLAPQVGTTATDDADGDHKIINDDEAVIRDLVAYENLVPGKEYTATGTLMVKNIDEAGNVSAEPLLDADGNPVTTTVNFTPKTASGTIDVVFVFDASALDSGTELVVFEKLLRGETQIAAHEDPSDSNQTVTIIEPEIGTTAVDGVDGDKNVVSDKNIRVIDTIEYKNLVVGKEYTATGKLMVKATDENGNTVEQELLDDNGNTVTAKTTFTPDKPNGTVEVEFVFDGYNLDKGTQIVAFEEVLDKDKTVAVHADIEDENQMVEIINPKIGTSAYDSFDLDSLVIADADAKIIDTVKYDNLVPGTEYTAYGLIMDKSTGLPLLTGEGADAISDGDLLTFLHGLATLLGISDAEFAAMTTPTDNGVTPEFKEFVGQFAAGLGVENPIAGFTDRIVSDANLSQEALSEYFKEHAGIVDHLTIASKTFKPAETAGSVDMSFSVNTEGLDGKQLVVYELMFANGVIAASHTDITDEGQTVTIVPTTIGTEATDKTDGDHYLLPSTEATVVDTVDYENVVPGKEYVLKGTLMNKATGKSLMVDDKPVTAELKFTPNNTHGKIDIEFTFDASKLADGAELVVFEELYKDDVIVAEHKDIDDESQTVTIGEPPAPTDGGSFDKTGQNLAFWIALALILLGGAAAIGIHVARQNKRTAKADDSRDESSSPDQSDSENDQDQSTN